MKRNDRVGALLTHSEIEIMKWVQQGKTNHEIGIILGKSKWTIMYHLKNIMKKLDVTSRTQAVSQAIAEGMVTPLPPGHKIPDKKMTAGIIGLGRGGSAVIAVLKDNPLVRIIGAADNKSDATGVGLARKLGIPVFSNYEKLMTEKMDILFNLTGSYEAEKDIWNKKCPETEIMGGRSSMLVWQLAERRKEPGEREEIIRAHENLYNLGRIIESLDSIEKSGKVIVDYATSLVGMPAGTLAVLDEERKDLRVVATKGFSGDFSKKNRWEIRRGGLTGATLDQVSPLFIGDFWESPYPDPLLIKEGIRSLLAAPVSVDGKVSGVLYVGDFKKRKIRAEDVSLFSLLCVYAALTIERGKRFEKLRRSSVIDMMTGLFNQHFAEKVLARECERAADRGLNLSVIKLDIENLEECVVTSGVHGGNEMQKTLADFLLDRMRSYDTVARLADGEFMSIMPEKGRGDALALVKTLLSELAAHKTLMNISVSVGIAAFPDDGKDAIELLDAADKRLFRSKPSEQSH